MLKNVLVADRGEVGVETVVEPGGSLVGALLVDVALFKEPWNLFRALCALRIVLGTCGLRLAASR